MKLTPSSRSREAQRAEAQQCFFWKIKAAGFTPNIQPRPNKNKVLGAAAHRKSFRDRRLPQLAVAVLRRTDAPRFYELAESALEA
jgi:hypothetical protein